MNSRRNSQNPQAYNLVAPEPHFPFGNWRSLLEQCRLKPSRKRVHGLRVATLRLQAQLDPPLGSNSDRLTAAAARRWSKQAAKLRESLSVVREFDVYRAKLSMLTDTLAAPSEYTPRSSSVCLEQIAELDDFFRRKRKNAARTLIADLQHRHRKLDNLSADLECAQALGNSLVHVSSPSDLVKMFSEAVAEFPRLDADCLHDFRKRIKNVRYLAELFAKSDAQAGRLAQALKTMQGIIGEWHDWHELAQLAARRLRKRHKNQALVRLLETLSDESLQKGLEYCGSIIAELLEETDLIAPRLHLLPSKPPAMSPEPIADLDQRQLA